MMVVSGGGDYSLLLNSTDAFCKFSIYNASTIINA